MSEQIPEGWERKLLKDLVSTVVAGQSPNRKDHAAKAGKYGILKTTAIDWGKYSANKNQEVLDDFKVNPKHEVKSGDILITKAGPVHRVGVVTFVPITPEKMLVSGKMTLLRTDMSHDPQFVSYALATEYSQKPLKESTTGMALSQTNFTHDTLLEVPLWIPERLPEQKKIAVILSSVDEVIEKTRAQIDKLKDLKTGMMQELLTKGIGHTEFKDSPVGRIPVEWDVVTLEQICDPNAPITYGVLKPGNYVDGGRPLLQIKDLGEGTILAGGLHLIGDDLDYEYRRSRVQFGDIVISLVGTIGRTAMIPCWLNQSNIHRNLGRIRTRHNQYVFQFLQSESAKLQLGLTSAGSSQSALNLSALRQMSLPLPSPDEAQEITKILSSVDERIKVTTSRLNQLNNVKKALMQDLLTGKVRVNLKI